MGNSDRVGRNKATPTLAAIPQRDLSRIEKRKVEARQRTRTDYVASPRVAGAVETVKRVVDTLDYLCTRGKLNEREQDAAGIYRSAWDMVQSSIGKEAVVRRAKPVPTTPATMTARRHHSRVRRRTDPHADRGRYPADCRPRERPSSRQSETG